MRTVVALVEARPETITEDFRRVLNLAQLPAQLGQESPQLLLAADAAEFEPGWGATPWQLAGTLAWLGERARNTRVAAVGERGVTVVPPTPWLQDCLAENSITPLNAPLARAVAPDYLRDHRHVSRQLHPALDAVLPDGVMVPVGLTERPVLVLTAPTVRSPWGVAAAGALLQSLVTRGAKPGRRIPRAEIAAEAVGVARELMPNLGVVVDGTLWGIADGPLGRQCLGRNILLAGADPVAVDAVAMRLAGADPMRVPWLRICHDRGIGQASPAEIRVVGRTDLLDLDFGLPDLDVDSRRGRFGAERGGALSDLWRPVGRLLRRGPGNKSAAALKGTAWEMLYEEHLAG